MVARGVGRDALLRLVGQPEHRVAGAPNLEGARFLKFSHLKNKFAPVSPFRYELVSTGVRWT